MYAHDDELQFKYAKPASEIAMPFLLRVAKEELERVKSEANTGCIGELTGLLTHRTYQSMLKGGFPHIAMGMLMSGWLRHFVGSCVEAVIANIPEARSKKGGA